MGRLAENRQQRCWEQGTSNCETGSQVRIGQQFGDGTGWGSVCFLVASEIMRVRVSTCTDVHNSRGRRDRFDFLLRRSAVSALTLAHDQLYNHLSRQIILGIVLWLRVGKQTTSEY